MNTEIANAVNAAGDKAQYDTRVKRLLAQKSILAHILVKTVDEFKGMKPEDFVNTNYDDIKQVFSIWICMNMDDNSLSHIHLTKDEMLKPCNWKGNLDLLNIVLIGITNEIPEHDEKYEMHRLIGALLSSELKEQEKLDIIEHEYNIPISQEFREM